MISVDLLYNTIELDYSESGSNEEHLSMEDMAKLIAENIKLLKTNQEKIEQMNERLHRACAEMENLKERITKEEKNSKKVINYFFKTPLKFT